MADQLTFEQLRAANPELAQHCGSGFIDAWRGPGGLYVVYTSGAFAYMLAERGQPTMVSIKDLGWSTEFAVSTARGLAEGLITATLEGGELFVSEEDSDRAWDATHKKTRPADGLLERWLSVLPWSQPAEALDPQIHAGGVWNEDKTELVLVLDKAFEPFKRLIYGFKNGTLDSVHARVDVAGSWKAMEWLAARLRAHFPSATWRLDDGSEWSLTEARPKLEGQAGAKVQLRTQLGDSLLVAVPMARQAEGKQYYCLALICFAPKP